MASQLTEVQIAAQERLRALVQRGVELRWQTLAGFDEEDVGPWLAAVVPLVLAAQRQSVTLTDAYLARTLQRQPLGLPVSVILGALRGGVSPQIVYRRPFVHVWTALSKGTPYEQAVAAGLAHAKSSAAMDVQLAHRAALQAVHEREPRIRGWRRAADADACPYCLKLDGAFVKSAEAMPMHPGCGCGLEPAEREPKESPLPTGVAVHEHGEYGPTLADPSHDFTTATDL